MKGDGQGCFIPAVQTTTHQAWEHIKAVTTTLHHLGRIILQHSISKFEWQLFDFVCTVNNVVGFGGFEPNSTSLQTLGARGYITSGYIVIWLWFFKQFIQPETSGYMLSFFKMYSPLWSQCRQQIHADHFYKENTKATSGHFLNENSGFFHHYDQNISSEIHSKKT